MMAIAAVVVVAVVVVAALAYVTMSDDGEDSDLTTTVNGVEYGWGDMEDKFGTRTVGESAGVPLGAIVNDTGLSNPGTYAYVLEASDGYAMAVNWTVLQSGIVTQVEEEKDGNTTTYLMTLFPDMPSAYKVKNFCSVEPQTLSPIALNGLEYYLDYMPKKVNQKTVVYNSTYTVTGYSLSDMVNYTGLSEPGSHTYRIVASDGFNKTVNWTSMLGGVVIKADTKTVFPGLSKGYMVKNVARIEVL
jgi:hypothetical protein